MSDFRLPPLNAGERIYRALLMLYPPRFRRAYALDLIEAFRDQRRDARRVRLPAVAFWMPVLQDVLTHAAGEWMTTLWRVVRRPKDADHGGLPMGAIIHAFRPTEVWFAVRRLLRVPGFTFATVVVLSLGIGATTAVFSVVNAVLLEPLPYPQSERLVALKHRIAASGINDAGQSDATILLYQEHARAFAGIAGVRPTNVTLGSASATQRPERVSAAEVSANLFDVLRIRPLIGRAFEPGEDRIGTAPVALLSYTLWQSRFQGSPSVVGNRINIDGVSRQIVGVTPRGFSYPAPGVQVFIPIPFDPAHAQTGAFSYVGVGRLRDRTTIAEAQADLARVLPRLLDEYPGGIPAALWKQAHVEPDLASLRDSLVGSVARMLWILLASVSLVLIVACANVANLFLVRGESRQLEFAVRSALGSSTGGIIAQSLSESVLLAFAGGGIGVALAAIGVHLAAAVSVALGLPRLDEVTVDARVLLFAIVASAFSAMFVSIIPAVRSRRVPIATLLGGSGRGTTARRQRTRSALVIAQTALALVLVVASGLLARSFMRIESVEPGFDADNLVIARLAIRKSSYAAPGTLFSFFDALVAKLRNTPGIESASLANSVPLSEDHSGIVIGVEDHPVPANALPDSHLHTEVDGQYFNAMHIPLLRGRAFGAQDPARPTLEAVVSRAFAKRYWNDESPLGKRIRPGLGGDWFTIVGEVADVHYEALDKPPSDIVYFPLSLSAALSAGGVDLPFTVFARSTLPSGVVTGVIRDAVHALDPTLPTYGEKSIHDVVQASSARARALLLVLAVASTLALVLGIVGIYGMLAYTVSLRRREIGVRLALGARPSEVRRMIARSGLQLAAVGIVIGVVVALGVTRFLKSFLYDVSATDPLIFALTSCALLFAAFMASWLPARRAASLDPSTALRDG